jgi:hypothetical protein
MRVQANLGAEFTEIIQHTGPPPNESQDAARTNKYSSSSSNKKADQDDKEKPPRGKLHVLKKSMVAVRNVGVHKGKTQTPAVQNIMDACPPGTDPWEFFLERSVHAACIWTVHGACLGDGMSDWQPLTVNACKLSCCCCHL